MERPTALNAVLLGLLGLALLGTACVEREIALYGIVCNRDTQCSGATPFCVDGVCASTPSRPPEPDAGDGTTIDRGQLRDQLPELIDVGPPTLPSTPRP
ncbi:MAG: hypothetical protein AAFX99_21790 [Myxococcota bacterium]